MADSSNIIKFLLGEEEDFGDAELIGDVRNDPVPPPSDPYEEWIEAFRPIQNPLAPEGPFDGWMFETYGPEFAKVQAANPRHVWTLLDAEGSDIIAAGLHYVNRIGYFITELPWQDKSFQVELPKVEAEE